MKRPTLAGHKLKLEGDVGYRAYTGQCECGKWHKIWGDRMSVVRELHAQHVRAEKRQQAAIDASPQHV